MGSCANNDTNKKYQSRIAQNCDPELQAKEGSVRHARNTLRDIRRSPLDHMEHTTTTEVRSNNLPFAEYCRLAKEDTWGVIKIKNVSHLILGVSFPANNT
jgi:hypothetical protein